MYQEALSLFMKNPPLFDERIEWRPSEADIEALKLSEERFRRYFDLGLVGMAITSPDKGILEVNDELCRILGYKRGELLQTTWAKLTHPDDLAADEAQCTRVMAGESDGYSLEKRWIRKDGRVIHSIMAAKCVRHAGGSVEYFVALVQDITERKRAEDEMRALKDQLATDLLARTRLHEFSTRLLGSTELMPILDELLSEMMELHHADFGCIQLYEPNTRSLRVVAQQGAGERVLDAFRSVPEDRASCDQAVHGLERIIIEDVETDGGSEPYRTIAATAGFRAVQSTALCRRSGSLLGMISTFFRDPHRPSESELTLTDLYARQAADFIERKQAEKALKDSEERFRLAIEGVKGYAMYMLDAEGRVATWNKGAEHATGYRSDEVLGKYHALFSQLNERDSLKAGQRLQAAASTGRFEDEGWQVRKNGSQYWANVVITGLRDDNGELQGFLKVIRDMTETHEARLALEAAYQEVKELKDKLADEKRYLESEIRTERGFEEIVGQSQALRVVLRQIEKVAPTDTTVLIQGETGTGKELIARALHTLSKRRDKTFVKVNCAAIPTGLLESELFGHERGAFTGAISQKVGRFELAHQGTIFLDEVGEIPPELQVKLLRVLQEHEFERLGSTRTQRVDIRVLAATNRDLALMVSEKAFRSDLYYRLHVFPVTVPALRERLEDIPSLVRYFTKKYARQLNKRIGHIPEDTMNALCRYAWPGNIRELENVIERCTILSAGGALELDRTLLESHSKVPSQHPATTLEDAERDHIRRVLAECHWVISGPSGAARKLGLKRTSLQYKMQKLGIVRPPSDPTL